MGADNSTGDAASTASTRSHLEPSVAISTERAETVRLVSAIMNQQDNGIVQLQLQMQALNPNKPFRLLNACLMHTKIKPNME